MMLVYSHTCRTLNSFLISIQIIPRNYLGDLDTTTVAIFYHDLIIAAQSTVLQVVCDGTDHTVVPTGSSGAISVTD